MLWCWWPSFPFILRGWWWWDECLYSQKTLISLLESSQCWPSVASQCSPVLLTLLVFAGQPPAVDGVVGAVPGRGRHVDVSLDGAQVQSGEIWVRIRSVKQFDDPVIFSHSLPGWSDWGPGLTWTLGLELQVNTVRGPGADLGQLGTRWRHSCRLRSLPHVPVWPEHEVTLLTARRK